MVLSNGPRVVRNQSSLVNRTNICGGQKKGGLAPTVGTFLSSNPNLIGTNSDPQYTRAIAVLSNGKLAQSVTNEDPQSISVSAKDLKF